jgi:hypothetical protein
MCGEINLLIQLRTLSEPSTRGPLLAYQGSKQYPFDKYAQYYDHHVATSCSDATLLNGRTYAIAIWRSGELYELEM